MVIYLCGVPIAWKLKGQKSVTLSTAESEYYYTMSELCTELSCMKQILEFLRIKIKFPIMVRVDNVGAMFLAEKALQSQRKKHIS